MDNTDTEGAVAFTIVFENTLGVAGIPADPGGSVATGGTGVVADIEGFVHIHRGVLGDNNTTGGLSDLKSTKHRWLNPVARAIITVK